MALAPSHPLRAWLARVAASAALAACCACALTDRRLELAYPLDAYAIIEASAVEPTTVRVLALRDDRRDPQEIGERRNGWGMRYARVFTGDSVLGWLRDALSAELALAGYEELPSGPEDADASIALTLQRAFAPDVGPHVAEVAFLGEARAGGLVLFRRRFEGVVLRGEVPAEATPTANLALALREALRSFLDVTSTALAAERRAAR